MLRRMLTVIILTLAASAAAFGQTNTEEARKEFNLGMRAYRNGRFAEAEQRLRRALELDPEEKNTRLYLARAVHQQFRPGLNTPENTAVGERAVATYQDILNREPGHEDAYKAIIFLYEQLKHEDKVHELVLSRANDFSLSNDKRAEAFVLLASKQWRCSFDITEQKENKTTEEKPEKTTEEKSDKVLIRYKMPADTGDFIRARQCATEGLQLIEQAVTLSPRNPTAWSYKANLLREVGKLAEMEGDAAQKAEYDRQYGEAFETQKRVAQEATGAKPTEEQAAPTNIIVGAPTDAASSQKKIIVSGGVLNGKAVSKPAPVYPPLAKAAGADGTVTVQILVDEGGNVISARAVSGHPLLQAAAVAAARQAKFSPTLLSGQRVKLSGIVTYNFVLQ